MTSIIVVTYNNLPLTKKCIESILKNTKAYELIIVDNASTDGTVEYLTDLSNKEGIKVIFNKENLGFPKANNQGILMSQGKYICLINNDVVVAPNWLLKLTRCMESDTAIGLVGPYTNYAAGYQCAKGPYYSESEYEEFAIRFSHKERDVDFLVFFCVLIRQEVIKTCGLLDADFGIGNFEDNLYCWQAKKAFYKLKIANCFVHHYGSSSFRKDTAAYNGLLAKNQKLFYRKTGREIKISCIMICSDNEQPKHLQGCLDSIAPWVDEVCIYFNYRLWPDKDKLKNLLGRYNGPMDRGEIDKVKWKYGKWYNDFAKARNESKRMAAGEWIVWLDSDDVFINPITLREAIAANDSIGDVIFCNVFAPCEDGVETHLRHARIFRNKSEYYWQKPIHEDIVLSIKAANGRIIHGDLVIRHIGYLEPGSTTKKNIRNLKIMERYIKTHTPDSLDYFHLANAYILLGSRQSKLKAIETIDKALAIPILQDDPLWPKMVFLKARIYHDIGNLQEAKKWYQHSIEQKNYIESYLGIAEVLVAEKNIDAALGYLEKMLEIGDKDGFEITSVPKNLKEMEGAMYYNLGYCYYQKEDYSKAKEFFAKCLQIEPNNLKAIDFACDILRKEKKHHIAFNITLQAVNKFPTYFHGWNNLAGFERLNKRYATAELFYRKALEVNPNYEDAKKNLEALDKERGKI